MIYRLFADVLHNTVQFAWSLPPYQEKHVNFGMSGIVHLLSGLTTPLDTIVILTTVETE